MRWIDEIANPKTIQITNTLLNCQSLIIDTSSRYLLRKTGDGDLNPPVLNRCGKPDWTVSMTRNRKGGSVMSEKVIIYGKNT